MAMCGRGRAPKAALLLQQIPSPHRGGPPPPPPRAGPPASAAATSFRYEAPALTFFCSAFMSSSAMAALLRWTRGTLSAAPSAVSRQAAGPGPLERAKLGPADLAADRFRQLADEPDLARVLVGRGDRLHVRLQLRGQRVGRLPARHEDDERLHDLAAERVGLADPGGLGRRGGPGEG